MAAGMCRCGSTPGRGCLVWGRCGARRRGEQTRTPCRGAEGWVPTGGEMLASPGDTDRVLTCSLGWKVCRGPCCSPVAFREPLDKQNSFQGWSPDAAVMGAWKQEGSACCGILVLAQNRNLWFSGALVRNPQNELHYLGLTRAGTERCSSSEQSPHGQCA